MSKETQLSSAFDEVCNNIHKIVGEYVREYEQFVSKKADGAGYTISLRAQCKTCKRKIMATVSSSTEGWSRLLIEYFCRRVEFHVNKNHMIIQAKYLPKRVK